jgi:hypothetical protein
MRRIVDPAADYARFAALVATEVGFRIREGDDRPRRVIACDVMLEIPSLPKLGRQIYILQRRIAARHAPPGRPAVGFT